MQRYIYILLCKYICLLINIKIKKFIYLSLGLVNIFLYFCIVKETILLTFNTNNNGNKEFYRAG